MVVTARLGGRVDEYRGLKLDRFQAQAIDSIDRGRNVIVAAPTGAGKTLIALFAIEQALQQGKRVIYTAPIKALSNQKFRDLTEAFPGRVGIATGDVSIEPQAPAVIMTTEIFRNTLFDDPARVADVSWVIFDEVHYLDDPERGTVWEESLIFAPPNVKVLALSATVSNLQELADWLAEVRGAPIDVVLETKRPVPLDFFVSAVGGPVRPLDEINKLRPDRRAAARERRDPRGRHGDRKRGAARGDVRQQLERAWRRTVVEVARRGELPLLFFLYSRDACERLSRACMGDGLVRSPQARAAAREEMRRLAAAFELDRGDPAVSELELLIDHGIAYHHAGLLPALKEVVERLFSSGHVRLLCATETFALGINMPARAVAFEGTRRWDGKQRVPLRTREFLQMAGRAGRRGKDPQGSVYITFDPDTEEPNVVTGIVQGRIEPVESRFNLSYGTLITLWGRLGERLYEACERSFASYKARMKLAARRGGDDASKRGARPAVTEHPLFGGPGAAGAAAGATRGVEGALDAGDAAAREAGGAPVAEPPRDGAPPFVVRARVAAHEAAQAAGVEGRARGRGGARDADDGGQADGGEDRPREPEPDRERRGDRGARGRGRRGSNLPWERGRGRGRGRVQGAEQGERGAGGERGPGDREEHGRHGRNRPGRHERAERRGDAPPGTAGGAGTPPGQEVAPGGRGRWQGIVQQVRRKLEILRAVGCIDEAGKVTARGRFAAQVFGHELEVTTLVFDGALDGLSPEQLAVVAVAVVFEGRQNVWYGTMDPGKLVGIPVFRKATRLVSDIWKLETERGVTTPVKLLDWQLSGPTWAWVNGAEFAELRDLTDASDGDIVRVLRQAIQVLRLVQPALERNGRGDIAATARLAQHRLKRGLVDAEWQLRKGAGLDGIEAPADPEPFVPHEIEEEVPSSEDLLEPVSGAPAFDITGLEDDPPSDEGQTDDDDDDEAPLDEGPSDDDEAPLDEGPSDDGEPLAPAPPPRRPEEPPLFDISGLE